jgi:hypothetical protein
MLTRDPPQSTRLAGSVRKARLAVSAAVLVLALSSASAHADSNKSIWGPVRMPDGSSAFPVYRDLGVRVLQLRLDWHSIAPERPTIPTDPGDPAYRWPPEIDEAVQLAPHYGIRLMLQVMNSPPWANGGRSGEWAPNDRDYARFLIAASRRYPSIRHWMIWGETNRREVFRPMPNASPVGPRRYARLLAAAYRGLKRTSRRNRVIGGMTWSFGHVYPAQFARWMRLPNGRPAPLDLWGHNPFTSRFPDLRLRNFVGFPGARDFGGLDTFVRELRGVYHADRRRFRYRGPRLWLSEFTIPSDRATYEFNFWTTRRGQARWVTEAYRVARRTPWIAGLGWIGLLDDPAGTPSGRTNGLMTYEGERKPAYFAYKRAR